MIVATSPPAANDADAEQRGEDAEAGEQSGHAADHRAHGFTGLGVACGLGDVGFVGVGRVVFAMAGDQADIRFGYARFLQLHDGGGGIFRAMIKSSDDRHGVALIFQQAGGLHPVTRAARFRSSAILGRDRVSVME